MYPQGVCRIRKPVFTGNGCAIFPAFDVEEWAKKIRSPAADDLFRGSQGTQERKMTIMKIAVVYWSSTGNTEAMAQAVAEGAKKAGAEVSLLTATEFDADQMDAFDAVAFGCPAMGAEELEDTEFAPMFEGCEAKLSGKKIALFGSYGWGDGEWMRTWEETCQADGAKLACDSVICQEAPDDEAQEACRNLGAALA